MTRPLVATVTLAAILGAGPAQADDDPIGARLKESKAAYETEATKFRRAVTDLLDEREKKAREKGNKAEVDRLKAELQAFVDRGTVPLNVPAAWTSAFAAARSKLEAAYRTAVKDYTKAKLDDQATRVMEDLETWLREITPPKPPPPEPKKPHVVSTWVHKVGKAKTGRRIKLYSNGHIDSPDGEATWSRKGQSMVLRWPAPKAPGGAWEDVCELSRDGKSYVGKNEKGYRIVGTKLADGDIEHKD